MSNFINVIGFVVGDTGKSLRELSASELYQEVVGNEPKYRTNSSVIYMCELCIVLSKKYNITNIEQLQTYMSLYCDGLVILVTCLYYILKCEHNNLDMSESVELYSEGLSEINNITYRIATSIIVDYTKRNNSGRNYQLACSHTKRILTNMDRISSAKLFVTDVKWICEKLGVTLRELDVDKAVLEIGEEYRGSVIWTKEMGILYDTDNFDIMIHNLNKLSK